MRFRLLAATGAAAFAIASAAIASQQTPVLGGHLPEAVPGEPTICRYVLTDTQGSRPFRLCLTKAQWKVADSRNSKDPNQIECHIQEDITTKLRSFKLCRPASEWRQETQDARDFIDQIQRSSCVPGGGCPG